MLKILPLVINLHHIQPQVNKILQVLMNPPSLLPKLTSKLDEILSSWSLLEKHSHRPMGLFHSPHIIQKCNFCVYSPILNYSWKFLNHKMLLFFTFKRDSMMPGNTNTFLTRKLVFSCHNVHIQLLFIWRVYTVSGKSYLLTALVATGLQDT